MGEGAKGRGGERGSQRVTKEAQRFTEKVEVEARRFLTLDTWNLTHFLNLEP